MSGLTADYILARDGTRLAYHATAARAQAVGPGVVFLGGFMSDMTGEKATVLEDWARRTGRAYLRLDYAGHGQSGGEFRDGTVGRWAEDALTVIRHAGGTVAGLDGPLVLVGSSMGGWIMLLVANALKEAGDAQQAAALVGIAAAPDFTADLLPANLGPEVMMQIERDGYVALPSDYSDEPYIVTRDLIADGNRNCVLGGPIDLDIPVRLLHGTADADVPWTQSHRLLERLTGSDVELTLIKDGGHRLSEPRDLARLTQVVETLCVQLAG